MEKIRRNGKRFAGIGARRIPRAQAKVMRNACMIYACAGHAAHHGGANGADKACDNGYRIIAPNNLEVFIPYDGYNAFYIKQPEVTLGTSDAAYKIAKDHHPAWDRVSSIGKQLHSRNSHIILGHDLQSPVDFILCWTPDAKIVGGTGQALRIAKNYNIKVFNLADKEVEYYFKKMIEKATQKFQSIIDKSGQQLISYG